MSIVFEFFDKLKRNLKRAEKSINFSAEDVGHVIRLSVGHRNKPTELEINYINTVLRSSKFRFLPEEAERPKLQDKDDARRVTGLRMLNSGIIPAFRASPNPLIKS